MRPAVGELVRSRTGQWIARPLRCPRGRPLRPRAGSWSGLSLARVVGTRHGAMGVGWFDPSSLGPLLRWVMAEKHDREKLIDVALDLCIRQGYETTTID